MSATATIFAGKHIILMIKDMYGEKWKQVNFNFSHVNNLRIQVSNFGRIKSFNKIYKEGNLLNGSMINGYRIIRLKFYGERDKNNEQQLQNIRAQIQKLSVEIKEENQPPEAAKLLKTLKKNLVKKIHEDDIKRVINYHSLIHKLVAEYFCHKPSPQHTTVGHSDYNKLNNYYTNLKWMTPEENFIHQQKSPHVIESKKNMHLRTTGTSKTHKLTVTKVMFIKKLINEGKSLRKLAKQFKVTETQLLRIKRGENWGYIQAAT